MKKFLTKSLDWILIGVAISAISVILTFKSLTIIRLGIPVVAFLLSLIGGPMLEQKTIKHFKKKLENGKK
jgi:hypothetical protein